jgi:hypothetical protein
MNTNTSTSGWVGWVYFAAVVMIVLGVFQAITGLIMLFNPTVLITTPNNLLFFNASSWAFVHFLIGALIAAAGFAVLNGKVWGRTIGVILAIGSAIANFSFIPTYPLWATVMIAVDFLVIYSLTAHGYELRT